VDFNVKTSFCILFYDVQVSFSLDQKWCSIFRLESRSGVLFLCLLELCTGPEAVIFSLRTAGSVLRSVLILHEQVLLLHLCRVLVRALVSFPSPPLALHVPTADSGSLSSFQDFTRSRSFWSQSASHVGAFSALS
jgi:hypothetical protein